MSRTLRKSDGLESKVLNFRPFRDKYKRRYIPYCNFGCHQGLILKPRVCEARNCTHYYKFYISSGSYGNSNTKKNT